SPLAAAVQNGSVQASIGTSISRTSGALLISLTSVPQDRAAHRDRGRAAGDQGELRAFDLVDRLAAELLDRLADVRHADHIGFGEMPAVRIDGDRAAGADRAALDEGAAFAPVTEAVVLELHDHQRREMVVEQGDVDVLGRNPGLGVETPGGVLAAGGAEQLV